MLQPPLALLYCCPDDIELPAVELRKDRLDRILKRLAVHQNTSRSGLPG
jgi:hypothetical protein